MANWPLIKEITGFSGTVLVLIPWFLDFRGRWQSDQIRAVRAKGSLADLVRELVAFREARLTRARFSDFAVTMSGLILIALSFAIGVALTM